MVGGVNLTARGQSAAGGWTYIPGGGDEGSVTVTQVQALRAAQNSGFDVPKGRSKKQCAIWNAAARRREAFAIRWAPAAEPRLPISAAAMATLYNAGEYDSPLANRCLDFVWQQFEGINGWSKATATTTTRTCMPRRPFTWLATSIGTNIFPPCAINY